MLEYNCYPFSCLAFHRQGRRLGRQVPMGIWKSSKKTGREQGGLWMPAHQVSQLTEHLPTPHLLPPTLVICRRGGPSSHSAEGSHC